MKVVGKVVKGQGFATIAFGLPTANLEIDEMVNLSPGTYVGETSFKDRKYPSVIYVGPVGSDRVETHLFGFAGDLYEEILEIEVKKLIGPHVAWESEEQMKAKVANDVQLAKNYFQI